MAKIERKDLIQAVLTSRDELDQDLDTELLEAIVDAQADAAGDGETALRAIEAAVNSAITRGVAREGTGLDSTAKGLSGESDDGDNA